MTALNKKWLYAGGHTHKNKAPEKTLRETVLFIIAQSSSYSALKKYLAPSPKCIC